jgi:two-component system, LuxR family, response regulator FixJ
VGEKQENITLGLTVDIVEDDDAVRDSLRALLESYGYTVHEYPSAEPYLKSDAPTPSDVLIVDHHMPGMTGLELVETLRARDVRIPTILVTGRDDPQLGKRMERAGIAKLLHKPVDDVQLVRWIEETCKH